MKVYAKTIEVFHVEINGEEFMWNEVMEVLDGLEDTNSFSVIVINDYRLKLALEAVGVIHTNIRGSSFKTDTLWTFQEELDEKLTEYIETRALKSK